MKQTTFELGVSLIPEIVRLTEFETYLELGIFKGETIRKCSEFCERCIGVDINNLEHTGFEFHQKTTDEFFKDFNEKIDVIFIDADHHFEQVKKDFINSLNCLNSPGIIMLHDTNPNEEKYLSQSLCGDSYKIHTWIKENYPELDIVTIPIGIAGITIVNRNNDRRALKFL